ncbi:hypothetical protein QYE76_064450 [Lolium multiflorum]|uniref:Integrase catalytic domain-containing protein n=1 Tax=Lolium multiflorum TaxID=4521 RepID=A0AAD8S7G9_LOLMU|nr:hypothetical protein QYE76_064450 [Lolium multiflorum]
MFWTYHISQGLKQQIETFELDKVKDLETIERAQLLAQELDASKKELEVAHASLTRDLDHLERANKLVKDELKKLGENHDLLQETYKKALGSMNDPIIAENVASSSTSFTCEHAKLVEEHVRLQEELSLHVETNTYLESLVTKYGLNYHPNESACEQANILEENSRLTKELAKFTTAKNKMGLDDLLSKQRSNNQKYGLGYAPKPYKKNNYKKEKPAQEKNKKVTNIGKASKGKATSGDRTGPNNHYDLFVDYYGDVYDKYVGPRSGYADRGYSIWGYASGGPKWVFDSGCTNHMTRGRGVLDQFIEDVNKKSSITFGDNSKERSDNLKLVLVGYLENNLYVVDLSKESPSLSTCLMAAKHDEAGKQLKKSHPIKSIVTTSRPLELLHLDLFGPSHYDTLGGSKYGLVIVDDYSRYSLVFLLKSKDETYREFITFAKKAQRMYESEIKAIRTDNGTEFKNYTMQEFVDDEGIKHEFSAPYTPQQNGVVERKNRTIIEMARTMLSEFNSPHNFWGEAISTAVHYSNRLFPPPLHNETPYELLIGNKPNVMYIRVFGCKCLVKNNKGKLGKFETRTIEGTFVGYAENSHANRYYNKSSGLLKYLVTWCSWRIMAPKWSKMFHVLQVKIYPLLKMSHIPKNNKKALNPLRKTMMLIKKHPQLMIKLKLSLIINFEPLKVHEALVDPDWVIAMQEELECFTRHEVWSLVKRSKDHRINVIGTKWVFKNKQDENGIVIRNKARKFEMSMMGELNFFLGFQVRQLAKGTFISQEKYVKDMLKKFNMTNASLMKTPMPVKGQLGSCDGEKDVDIKLYRSMIGSLLYLCASRPDIMLSVGMCARFQSAPKESHLMAVKWILRYLVLTPTLGLWYQRGQPLSS